MSYEIEVGVPRPVGRSCKYPWDLMQVGDSFFVADCVIKNIYANLGHANKRYAPKKFKGHVAEKDGARGKRIWRVA